MPTTTKQHPVQKILKEQFTIREDEALYTYTEVICLDGDTIVATNGHILAAIDCNEYPDLRSIGEKVPGYPKWESVIITEEEIKMTGKFALAELETPNNDREPISEKCSKCEGEGGVPHDCFCDYCTEDWEECSKCMGEGIITTGGHFYSLIQIGEWCYKSHLMNSILELFRELEIETVTINQSSNSGRALRIDSKGVTAIVMPYYVSDFGKVSEHFEITKTINLKTEN